MAKKTKKKPARKQAKKTVRRPTKPASRKTTAARAKAASRTPKRRKAGKTRARAAKPKPVAKKVAAKAPAKKPARARAVPPPARLQRERRRLPEAEEERFLEVSEDSRLMSAARAGHDELRSEIRKHTASSPLMTAGDVDAKWQDAYALGDEAPGGDNMTPDQDRVDDIGKALGIEYADDEELLGGQELTERDEHRWELDPASKDEDEEL